MKTFNSLSVKATAKKAITLGLAAMMIVSCGKSKNKVDENAVASNPFGLNTSNASEAQFINSLLAKTNCSRVNRYFNYSNGQLSNAGNNGAAPLATYVGVDPRAPAGTVLLLKDYGNGNYQYAVSFCRTGDQYWDNVVINSPAQIAATFTGDLNVPNRAQCPSGRVNSGALFFGYDPAGYPIDMIFQPAQECL